MIAEEYFGRGLLWVSGGLWNFRSNGHFGVQFSAGASDSGTADAAVSTTDTTLTDTRETWTTDEWIGAYCYCNGQTLIVTSNTATTLTGAAWSSGGNPGNGFAWSMTFDVFRLPDATRLDEGHRIFIVNGSIVSEPLHVTDNTNTIVYPTLAALKPAVAILIDNSTQAGTWYTASDGTAVAFGSLLADTAEVFDLEITEDTADYDIRAAVDALGFTGDNPALVSVTIKSGVAVIGSTTSTPAMRTGVFPALSAITLVLEPSSWLLGRGGDGGDGGIDGGADATDGGDGGLALNVGAYTQIKITGDGYTRIAGGSGGGGGGAQAETGNTGDGGGGVGGSAAGAGGVSGDGSDGATSLRDEQTGYTVGFPGQPEPGSDAASGGITGLLANDGQDGFDSASDVGGSGGTAGAAIQYSAPFVFVGDSEDHVYGDYVTSMSAQGAPTLTGTGTLGDA